MKKEQPRQPAPQYPDKYRLSAPPDDYCPELVGLSVFEAW